VQAISEEETHPMILKAEAAFRRDLKQLLKERPGQWVAYHGDRRIGFADDDLALAKACLEAGIDLSEFIVKFIEPQTGNRMIMGPVLIKDSPMDEIR
jgi:hypothetical protein